MTKNKMLTMVLLISLFYLFLSSGNFFAISTAGGADDYLQFEQARSITKGEWLGDYNFLTLSKGVSYPLWIAFLHSADIPFWLGNALLYMGACLIFIYVLRRIITNKLILISIYTLILFNPIVIPRTYRDAITPAVGLFLLAWAIGIFLLLADKNINRKKGLKEGSLLTLVGTIFLPVWVFLREDYMWLLPFIGIMLGISFMVLGYKILKRKQPLSLLLISSLTIILPTATVCIAGYTIAHLNKQHYERAVINDFTSDDFEGAYGALSRVIGDDYNSEPARVPVSGSSRQKAYAVSPAFHELKTCLDSDDRKSLCEAFKKHGDASIYDYEGGWFVWVLRAAVQDEGYYKNANTAENYYKRLSYEVNQACEDRVIRCHSERSSLAPVFNKSYIKPTADKTLDTLLFTVKMEFPDKGTFMVFSGPTPEQDSMAHYSSVRYSAQDLNKGVKVKHKAQKVIYKIYWLLNAVLFVVSVFIIIIATSRVDKVKKYWREIFIAWCLLLAICFRIVMIAYVDVTSFNAVNNSYLSAVYPIMLLFESVVLGVAGAFLLNRRKQNTKVKLRGH